MYKIWHHIMMATIISTHTMLPLQLRRIPVYLPRFLQVRYAHHQCNFPVYKCPRFSYCLHYGDENCPIYGSSYRAAQKLVEEAKTPACCKDALMRRLLGCKKKEYGFCKAHEYSQK
jgi:hypothetical protein